MTAVETEEAIMQVAELLDLHDSADYVVQADEGGQKNWYTVCACGWRKLGQCVEDWEAHRAHAVLTGLNAINAEEMKALTRALDGLEAKILRIANELRALGASCNIGSTSSTPAADAYLHAAARVRSALEGGNA